jgi:hypothetical protein
MHARLQTLRRCLLAAAVLIAFALFFMFGPYARMGFGPEWECKPQGLGLAYFCVDRGPEKPPTTSLTNPRPSR